MKEPGLIFAHLVCLESARYTIGTDTTTVSEPIWEKDLTPITVASGITKIKTDWRIQIPLKKSPSFSGQNNKIYWGINVWLEIPDLTYGNSNFVLLVEPEGMR